MLIQVHDSLLGQYPIRSNFNDIGTYIPPGNIEDFARAMIRCTYHLNPTLQLRGRDFEIGTDLKIGTNWGNMVEVKLSKNIDVLTERIRSAMCRLGDLKTG